MNRVQSLLVLVAVALAAALAGVGLYANAQPEPLPATELVGDEFIAPVPCGGEGEPPCRTDYAALCTPPYEDDPLCDAPPAALRPSVAPWWWVGAGVVLLVGAGTLPFAGGHGRPLR